MTSNLPSIRVPAANPNHHLYNNNGTWWVHFTLHGADFTKRRVRESLGTADVRVARERRDVVLVHLQLEAQLGAAA